MAEKDLENGHVERPEIQELEAQEIPEEEIDLPMEPEESEVERLTRALAESDERYLRLVAEYDNYRKRTSKEKSELYPIVTADTVAKFLPVLDTFECSLEYDCGTEEFAKGIELIHQNFLSILEALKVQPVGEVGETFDPAIHYAVMHVEDPEQDENVVTMVMQKGYRIGDRIIRHAAVQTAN